MKLNSFLALEEIYTNDMEDYDEVQNARFKDLFNVPNEREHKIIRKVNKIRNTLHKLVEADNQIGEDFVEFDEARFKKSDIFELLK